MDTLILIFIGIFAVAVAGLAYFFYNKVNTQQETITKLVEKCASFEHSLYRPGPEEIDKVLSVNDEECENCSLDPVNVDTEEDLEALAREEIERVKNKEVKKV